MNRYELFWAEDEDAGKVGFLKARENVFWVHHDTADAWAFRHFSG